MPLSPEKGSSATNIMPADWAKDVQALVRRHKYNFDAAAKEVGATAKELRMELARQEFGDEAGAPKPKAPAQPVVRAVKKPAAAAAAADDDDDDAGLKVLDVAAMRARHGLVPRAPPPKAAAPVDAPATPAAPASWDPDAFFEAQRLRDLENFAKKEAIFDRVLASLGGGDGDASSSVPSDVLEAFEKQRAEERERLERLDAKKKERDELRELAAQREALRRRFDEDSPDAEGVDQRPVAETIEISGGETNRYRELLTGKTMRNRHRHAW